MDKFIKLLKICLVILVVIIVIIGIVLYKNRGRIMYGVDEIGDTEEEIAAAYKIEEEIQFVTHRNNFYIVKNCIEKFYNYIAYESENPSIENKKYIYNLLDSEYINAKTITQNNVLVGVEPIKESTVNITNMYVNEKTINMSIYSVEGFLIENDTNRIIPFQIIVKLDLSNRRFSILPDNYVKEKYSNIGKQNNLDSIQVLEEIEKNENNEYVLRNISNEEYISNMLDNYKNKELYNPELAYEYLDEEYRNTKFGSLDNFKQYVNENKERISSIVLDKYQKTITDDYTQYVCIDKNGNYYIFRETAVMQYSLLLDTYTIDIPEFTEKYNKADNETKVGMNIEKVLLALNNKDYNYIYGKLASGFKNNYFPTVDSLKQYMQTNLFEKNTVEYDTVDNEGINYMFDIKFNNAQDTVANPVSKRIIMQLKEGTDFVFSFNVD